MSIGFLASPFVPDIPLVMGTFGAIAGFGAGLVYLPANIAIGYYFESKRSKAAAITRIGGSMGQFVYAPLITFLIDNQGLKVTLFVIAGLAIICVFCGILMRPLGVAEENGVMVAQNGPLYKNIWESKPKESTKVLRTFSRVDIFHQGSIQHLMRANKVSSGWDENRHLLFSTSR